MRSLSSVPSSSKPNAELFLLVVHGLAPKSKFIQTYNTQDRGFCRFNCQEYAWRQWVWFWDPAPQLADVWILSEFLNSHRVSFSVLGDGQGGNSDNSEPHPTRWWWGINKTRLGEEMWKQTGVGLATIAWRGQLDYRKRRREPPGSFFAICHPSKVDLSTVSIYIYLIHSFCSKQQ